MHEPAVNSFLLFVRVCLQCCNVVPATCEGYQQLEGVNQNNVM